MTNDELTTKFETLATTTGVIMGKLHRLEARVTAFEGADVVCDSVAAEPCKPAKPKLSALEHEAITREVHRLDAEIASREGQITELRRALA